MTQPTRRVRAGAPPPHMPVIDFAEPEPPEKSPPSAGDWLGLAILLALACGICFVVGMYFGKWVMA